MTTPSAPQIYLLTPPDFDPFDFPDRLAACLDATEVACVRLALASHDEDRIARAADALRQVTHDRDIALVIESHVLLAQRLGLDGVHLIDGSRSVRAARKTLGKDSIVGAFCGQSRHDGMTAGEIGADYISFGPVGAHGLGDGTVAEPELFEWWSQMIEVPVVAEGGLTGTALTGVAPFADFLGLGAEVWDSDDPAATLAGIVKTLS